MLDNNVILVASNNVGKIKEIKDIFCDFSIVTLGEMEVKLNKKLEVQENGNSFKENALLKAKELLEQLDKKIFCMGDDSGLCIDALDGFPGIYTNRWMDADDHIKNLALLEKMANVPSDKRSCHYTTAIAITNGTVSKVVEYSLDGSVATSTIGNNGFGFDEIFKIDSGKTLAEISSDEKYLISPRKMALEKIKNFLMVEKN